MGTLTSPLLSTNTFVAALAQWMADQQYVPCTPAERSLLRAAPLSEIQTWAQEKFPGSVFELLTPEETAEGLTTSPLTFHSLDEICVQAEHILSSSAQQQSGSYFTPPSLAARICRTLNSLPGTCTLDPAMGSGIFLIAKLRTAYAQGHLSIAQTLEALLELTGVERDPRMCSIARTTLALAFWELVPQVPWSELRLSCSLRTFDALTTPLAGENSWHSHFPHSIFGLIIGNPPFGISRDGGFSEHEDQLIREQLGHLINGKINKYIAFLARSYELLEPHGTLTFITPNAWLGIANGRKLRSTLLRERSLVRIERFDTPLFETLGVETDIVTLRKSQSPSEIRIERFQSSNCQKPHRTHDLPYKLLAKLPDYLIPADIPLELLELAVQILATTQKLGSLDSGLIPSIALQAYAVGKGSPPQTAETVRTRPFDCSTRLDAQTVPYLEGRDITQFAAQWSGKYLRWGPWLAEPQLLERFTGPRVLIREVLGVPPRRLRAVYVTTPYLYNKSILHILPGDQAMKPRLPVIEALLNSSIAGTLISVLGRKSQRKIFPKIVLQDLTDFPVPAWSSPLAEEIAAFVRAHRMQLGSSMRLQEELERLVRAWYGLSENEVQTLACYSPPPAAAVR